MAPVPPSVSHIPAIHKVLARPPVRDAVATYGRARVTAACRQAVARLRRRVLNEELTGKAFEAACAHLDEEILHDLIATTRPAYPEVINASGVIIHTNLGRAPLPPDAPGSPASYLALEYDLERGVRGQRLAPLRARLAHLCGAEWAVMVNNNAAAVLLILSAHASGREVIVSRGQLIEIGGSFRLPDVMSASGCRLVEVGCTNRTHLADYERAVTSETAAILVAHHSNFRMLGFTTSPPLDDLAALAHSFELPLVVDQGSGCLYDLRRWDLEPEPTVVELLARGVDMVCFSGDKLLGGPQGGIVVGARRWVEPLGAHPLYRALRPDKTALVTMDRVVEAHLAGHLDDLPLYAMLSTSEAELGRRARRLARRLRSHGVEVEVVAMRATLGGGTTPAETIPSRGLALAGGQALADRLRAGAPPVIGRLEEDRLLLDLRTVLPDRDRELERTLLAARQPAPPSSGPGSTQG